ncbi:MAG: ACT domain-containing protein [Bacteroidales bacterium]|nr:ACT domain-containing protein [Bacteroidales bacterium]
MITLIPLNDSFYIYQFGKEEQVPSSILESNFYSITQTDEELSVLTNCKDVSSYLKVSKPWKGFKVKGILDFSLVGIIHDITKPLKENGISVFVISTYNTDYVFVQEEFISQSMEIFMQDDNIEIEH